MSKPASTTTFVIRHPVSITADFLFGEPTGFPDGTEYLTPALIRRVQASMLSRGVQRYEDGRFHGEISRLGLYDLLAHLSVADAHAEGFFIDTSKKDLTVVHLGIRWTVSDTIREVRVYGPKSDPNNAVLIDLTKPAPEGGQ